MRFDDKDLNDLWERLPGTEYLDAPETAEGLGHLYDFMEELGTGKKLEDMESYDEMLDYFGYTEGDFWQSFREWYGE